MGLPAPAYRSTSRPGRANDGSGGIETYYSIENVTGSGNDDFLTGNGQSNTLSVRFETS